MKPELIIVPVAAVVLLTYIIGIWMVKLRFRAVRQDGVNPGYFQLNRGAKIPDYLAKVSNHYANLFEMPVLFYAVCAFIYTSHHLDALDLALAWCFVAARYAHAYIHTTSNQLKHRRRAFFFGAMAVAAMWIKLLYYAIAT